MELIFWANGAILCPLVFRTSYTFLTFNKNLTVISPKRFWHNFNAESLAKVSCIIWLNRCAHGPIHSGGKPLKKWEFRLYHIIKNLIGYLYFILLYYFTLSLIFNILILLNASLCYNILIFLVEVCNLYNQNVPISNLK